MSAVPLLPDMPDALAAALGYARRGWPVAPAHRPVADQPGGCSCGVADCASPGKHPTRPRGLYEATTNLRQVESWWRHVPAGNILIRTGAASGIIVLDTDAKADGEAHLADLQAAHGALPDTLVARTGSGGRHYLFRHPGGLVSNSVGALAPGVDTRGDGGYIIAAPSLHVSGGRYTWLNDLAPAELPAAWIALLPRPKAPALAVLPRPAPDGEDGTYWLDQALLQARQGERNARGFWLSCQLRDAGYDEAEAADYLERYARALGGDYTVREALHSLDQAYTRAAREKAKSQHPPATALVLVGANGLHVNTETGEVVGDDAAKTANDGLPTINTRDKRLRDVVTESLAALTRVESLYQRGGVLLRLRRDDTKRRITEPLSGDALKGILERCADYWTYDGKRKCLVPISPPMEVVRDMQALPEFSFRYLAGIVETPIVRSDGTILDTPGYDAQSRLFFEPPAGLCIPPIPENPDDGDVAAAIGLFDDMLHDFPFADGAIGRAHAMALVLTPFMRDLIDGPVPLMIIDASGPGSGKGLLADVCCLPAFGTMVGNLGECGKDDEWRKQITSTLLESTRIVRIDNIANILDSASLARALTSTIWEDRVLGGNKIARLPVQCTWVGMGNNVAASSEITRRIVPIRLEPNEEHPELRSVFRHMDLKAWAKVKRGDLIAAALTLIRAWYQWGAPAGPNPVLGSYEAWSATVGGILHMAGVTGFLDHLKTEQYDAGDSETAVWGSFVQGWWDTYGGSLVLSKDLIELAWGSGLPLRAVSPHAQKVELGMALRRQRGRVIAGKKLTYKYNTASKVTHWWLNADPKNRKHAEWEEV